jgi:aryl-alcohol dehydrogenase-like predicted oxidoreductase
MQKRKLGNSHLEVSAPGLGCTGMGMAYGLPPDMGALVILIDLVGCWHTTRRVC